MGQNIKHCHLESMVVCSSNFYSVLTFLSLSLEFMGERSALLLYFSLNEVLFSPLQYFQSCTKFYLGCAESSAFMTCFIYFKFDKYILKSVDKILFIYFWFCFLVLLTISHQLGPRIVISNPVRGC